ncbi:MAG: MATE family efflux transporter [Muribaculaceae bacterium]|nr:MATE family efflux transporter [Muribaculaceae bacterium]
MRERYLQIIRLGWPILVGQLGMIFVGFADNIMVGRYSTEALASASFVNNVFNIAILACIGFTYGITPVIGALFAKGDDAGIGAEMRASVEVNIVYALLITACMGGLYFALPLLGQPEELLPLIRPYFLTCLAGVLPVGLFNVFSQWSYGVNDTKTPTAIVLVANGLNVVGNYALIYGHWGMPELGLTGAGLSTLVSRLLCPVVMYGVFRRGRRAAGYQRAYLSGRLTWGKALRVVRGSLPLSLQMAFETGAFSGAAIIAGWLGAVALASFQIIIVVGMLGFCIYYSIGSATSVLVAHAAGRGSGREMRRMAWAGYHVMLGVMCVSSLVFLLCGRGLMGVFTDDVRVLELSYTLILPLVLYQLGDATQISFANSLRGTGHVVPMFWIALVSYMVAGLPCTYLFAIPFGWGLVGIVLSFSVSLFLAGALFLVSFLRATGGQDAR